MARLIRISKTLDVGRTIMRFAAEDDDGPVLVRIGLMDWERLRMAPSYLDDEDRRDIALSEIEQLCTPDCFCLIDRERVVDISRHDVDTIVARYEATALR